MTIAAMLVLVYLGLGVVLFALQRLLIYFPGPAAAVPGTLHAGGIVVLVTVAVSREDKALLYFGGNGEDVNLSLGLLEAKVGLVTSSSIAGVGHDSISYSGEYVRRLAQSP